MVRKPLYGSENRSMFYTIPIYVLPSGADKKGAEHLAQPLRLLMQGVWDRVIL